MSALVTFAAEITVIESTTAAPARESEIKPVRCPDATAPDPKVEMASNTPEPTPRTPAPSREKTRPNRRPAWPPPPELVS